MSLSQSVADRAAAKFDLDDNGCWVWTGCCDKNGYGKIRGPGGKRVEYVHRAVYEDVVGPIPEGLELDHLCRNRSCINPDHLEPVTRLENMRRAGPTGVSRVNADKTECIRGHPLSGANLYVTPDGRRQCRICRRG